MLRSRITTLSPGILNSSFWQLKLQQNLGSRQTHIDIADCENPPNLDYSHYYKCNPVNFERQLHLFLVNLFHLLGLLWNYPQAYSEKPPSKQSKSLRISGMFGIDSCFPNPLKLLQCSLECRTHLKGTLTLPEEC